MRIHQLSHIALAICSLLQAEVWALGDNKVVYLEAEALFKAAEKARVENKYILAAFLGDGWSVSSGKFKSQVLETSVFREFADNDLVYFPVEARRRPKLSSAETAVLQSWVINFDIKSYPTFILLAPDGQELLRHGYKDIDPMEYVDLLRAALPDRVSQRN